MKNLTTILFIFYTLCCSAQTRQIAENLAHYNSLDRLKTAIDAEFNSPDSIAKCAYYWIALNISYDYETALQTDIDNDAFWEMNSFDKVFASRKAVCAGYVELYSHILSELDIENVIITGTSRTERDLKNNIPLSENHAWSAYKNNGNWHLVDATWASTTKKNNTISDYYFQADPEYFILSHFPTNPEWQLLDKPITYNEFYESVLINSLYNKVGLGNQLPVLEYLQDKKTLLLGYHEYWRPKLMIQQDSTFTEIEQTLTRDSDNGFSKIDFEADPNSVLRIDAHWTAWDTVIFKIQTDIGLIKLKKGDNNR